MRLLYSSFSDVMSTVMLAPHDEDDGTGGAIQGYINDDDDELPPIGSKLVSLTPSPASKASSSTSTLLGGLQFDKILTLLRESDYPIYVKFSTPVPASEEANENAENSNGFVGAMKRWGSGVQDSVLKMGVDNYNKNNSNGGDGEEAAGGNEASTDSVKVGFWIFGGKMWSEATSCGTIALGRSLNNREPTS